MPCTVGVHCRVYRDCIASVYLVYSIYTVYIRCTFSVQLVYREITAKLHYEVQKIHT